MANNYNNKTNTIGSGGINITESAASAVRARAHSELAKAAEEAQNLLQDLNQDAAQNERMQINLFDLRHGGALISKGSGDKMRARKIYQILYDKVGAADWKITDITPANGEHRRPHQQGRRFLACDGGDEAAQRQDRDAAHHRRAVGLLRRPRCNSALPTRRCRASIASSTRCSRATAWCG